MAEQFPLPFPDKSDFGVDFIEAPSNAAALAWLARTREWPSGRLALWGVAGCGKTHLLHLWALRIGAQFLAGDALNLKDLPPRTGLAIDDADTIGDESVLLHTLNAAAEERHPVLIASQRPPARWHTRLPDLASRLRAMTAVEIGPPDEPLLRALLMKLLADRQVNVAPAVQDWLVVRMPRSPAVVREAVARLDLASLTAGGPITRSLARRVLSDLLNSEESSPDQ